MTPLLFALPWLGLIVFERFVARFPSELPDASRDGPDPGSARGGSYRGDPMKGSADPADAPSISVVVPARNEELDIVGCLRAITASAYPDFELIVVDDRSEDRTPELARAVPRGNARRLEVVDGRALPAGWLGKPWACHQGAKRATGDLLLFTDADTTHAPDLMTRALAGLREERADLLTVVGRQLMESFWERLVQPHIFFLMLMRFPDFERVARNDRWRDAIANGQFLLFTRAAYERIGGHEAVKDEVVEDLALAQHVKRAGLRLRIRGAEESLATRMYRSLPELIEGWSKNIVMGGLQSVPVGLRPILPPVSFVGAFLLWLAAPTVLLAAALGGLDAWVALAGSAFGAGALLGEGGAFGGARGVGGAGAFGQADTFGEALLVWAIAVYTVCVVLWARFSHRMGVRRWYGFLYPLGAAVVSFIFLRSWIRGGSVEWKGRSYEVRPASERP